MSRLWDLSLGVGSNQAASKPPIKDSARRRKLRMFMSRLKMESCSSDFLKDDNGDAPSDLFRRMWRPPLRKLLDATRFEVVAFGFEIMAMGSLFLVRISLKIHLSKTRFFPRTLKLKPEKERPKALLLHDGAPSPHPLLYHSNVESSGAYFCPPPKTLCYEIKWLFLKYTFLIFWNFFDPFYTFPDFGLALAFNLGYLAFGFSKKSRGPSRVTFPCPCYATLCMYREHTALNSIKTSAARAVGQQNRCFLPCFHKMTTSKLPGRWGSRSWSFSDGWHLGAEHWGSRALTTSRPSFFSSWASSGFKRRTSTRSTTLRDSSMATSRCPKVNPDLKPILETEVAWYWY